MTSARFYGFVASSVSGMVAAGDRFALEGQYDYSPGQAIAS